MEMMRTIRSIKRLVRSGVCMIVFMLITSSGFAQPFTKLYAFKDGKMHIELSSNIALSSLDSFVKSFNLRDIGLFQLIKTKSRDSLKLLGWQVEQPNSKTYIITKPLAGFDNFNNPSDKIIFTGKYDPNPPQFPAVNNGILIGYNRFRNKTLFERRDSMVTFYLRNNTRASKVMLAGSFNNWSPTSLTMRKTDSGWIARVKLGPGKYWYKFIVDGNWRVDDDNLLKENDGRGNTNSVFFNTNVMFKLSGFTNTRRVYLAGSFNNWKQRDIQMESSANGWQLPVYLAEGTHTYRFIVDGRWTIDGKNSDRLPNEFGEYNSVIKIGKPHLFKLNGYTNAKAVGLSGNFNGWRKNELYMRKTASGWELPYVLGPGNYEYKFWVDGKWVTDPSNRNTITNGQNTGNSFIIISPNYTFKLKGYPNAKSVHLAGDFNNWMPSSLPMQLKNNEWVVNVHLYTGKHLYKFLVDGKWIIDPANKLWEQNEYGSGNSVIWIED
jgi:hypothetical protein